MTNCYENKFKFVCGRQRNSVSRLEFIYYHWRTHMKIGLGKGFIKLEVKLLQTDLEFLENKIRFQ